MRMKTLTHSVRTVVCAGAVTGALLLTMATAASAQTITLAQGNATTLRGGTYASSNFSNEPVLETRASSDATYVRRGLLKFDTHTLVPAGASIASARLTITMAGGNSESRKLSAYAVNSSYDEAAATWNSRKASTKWGKAGGDLGSKYAAATVTNAAGSKVNFDVTALVQAAVRGDFGTRYTRLALIDEGGSSQASYKRIHSEDASNAANRPTLTVTLGKATTSPTPSTPSTPSAPAPSTSTSSSTLRVLQYNTHHGGYGTDGRYDTNRLADAIVKGNPDVVLLNEIEKYTGWGNQNQPEVYKNLLQSKTGKTWYYIFAQEFGDWNSNGKGNMILSRVPIRSVDRHELVNNGDRSIAQGTITWNGRPITLMVTHLDPDSQSLRLKQATEVTNLAASQPENKIVTGDMNAWPDQSSIAHLNKYFYDTWAVAESKGTATAFSGNSGETKTGRIDYIFYSKKSTNLKVKSSQVYDTRKSGVMPSDHRPVLTVFTVN
jgi:endonuclease/exonuclease/phosphatase family metal-dependent hydrolase